MDFGPFVFIAFAGIVVFFLYKKGRLDKIIDKFRDMKD